MRFELYTLEQRRIGAIECERATQPAFLHNKGQESFYIRNGPSNIELSVIINQTFNILIDQSTNITVNNVTINNGRIEKSDSGYVLTSIKTDTLVFTIEITREDDTDTVHVRIIRNGDGTVSFEIVENDVEIIVVDSDKSKPGVATITIGKPGTVEVEARFDKENVPEK